MFSVIRSSYLWAHGLGARDFGTHAEQISKRGKEASPGAGACRWSPRPPSELRQRQQAEDRGTDRLLNEQVRTNWVQLLNALVEQVHSLLHFEMCVNYRMKYFSTCQDSEWATVIE